MKTRKGNKVYPLTAAQNLHFYCLKYCPAKQVLNIGSSLTIQVDLNWDVLRECIKEAIDRCEAMRLRFAEDKDGTVYQYVVRQDDSVIEQFDFTGWTQEEADAKMREWTETPFARYDSPMHRIVIIKMPDGFQGIYIAVDHMTMDAQSLILFFRDIIELYASRMYEGIDYPKPMSSYIKQLKKDLEYEAGSKASQKDREFFQKLIASSEPIFADIYGPGKLEAERKATGNPNLRAATNTSNNVDANITTFHLETDPSARMFQFCEDQQVSMTCLLLMGLRTYLQKENNLDDISVTTTIARRATLQEKRSGGTRIHCFPFRTIVPREDTFIEGIYKIRDMQNQYFRHANFSPTEYYYYRSQYYKLADGQTYEPLSLTYQPLAMRYEGPGLEKLDGIQYRTARYSNGVAAHTLYLTVSQNATDNGLDFCFEYQTGVVTPEKLQEIYYYLCRIIFRGIEDCSRTVGEVIDWS
ncbi:MAG TPA: peptide synthetase [Candidatus Caccovicinus merdipullorum]|uniref:Peptide synthetase n=1 Tax=Candidatus Caccovicinus merdipullorum TaxID=2840724 RepID=A0A9D1GHZ3_9FIRM|nr:peptide synthetase [Candidatus Caccovicinus merdipullorum]